MIVSIDAERVIEAVDLETYRCDESVSFYGRDDLLVRIVRLCLLCQTPAL